MATIDGLDELKAAVEQLPSQVTAALKGVAHASALRIQSRARQILTSKIHGHGPDRIRTVDAIVVIEEDARKQFVVTVQNPENPNLGLWLERGTKHMEARPFMRPAGDEEDPRYKRDSLAAAHDAARALDGLT